MHAVFEYHRELGRLATDGVDVSDPDQHPIPESVALLLAADGIQPNLSGRCGFVEKERGSPLHYAARLSCWRVVQLLLERADVDPTAEDDGGRFPLGLVRQRRHRFWTISHDFRCSTQPHTPCDVLYDGPVLSRC